ncbi:MAG: glycosyltransferase [Flavobacteriales bacterium]|jgi:glycosyltransferase involved in cell wall biosynthesis|nr:glycosyltransferase [Flavobacteriales bacterium]
MRVLQLIDSLDAGGAERMSVTIANALSTRIDRSYLCTSRKEGVLKSDLKKDVGYLFLRKQSSLDIAALFRLKRFVTKHKIDVVHAHTTSYFLATLLKGLCPRINLVWHEHHGKRTESKASAHKILRFCSRYFDTIITVNEALQDWCSINLHTRKVICLKNFVNTKSFDSTARSRENNIICLANLREPKDHLNLLSAFRKIHKEIPNWKLQLMGKDFQDIYSEEIKKFIKTHSLQSRVTFLSHDLAVNEVLEQAKVGVLSSTSEGLPIALLEYGAAGLAVVTTAVGDCEKVISTFGKTVAVNDSEALANAILGYASNETLRTSDATAFRTHIAKNYSVEVVISQLIELYSFETN